MRKFLGLLLIVVLTVTAWPQAQSKPLPSPTPQTHTSAPCKADYYRNSDGVCVDRPVEFHDSSALAGATA